MKIRFSDNSETIFDFSAAYDGYYPPCRFTAAAAGDNLFYAAGTEASGIPRLYSSTDGKVWAPVNIASNIGAASAKDYGDIVRILVDPESRLPLLVARNGFLVIIPDCPRCVSARRISDTEIVDAQFRSGTLWVTDISGAVSHVMLRASQQFRCDWAFARPMIAAGGLLFDLREKTNAHKNPLPGARVVPADVLNLLLGRIPRDIPLFFVCEYGIKAEEAVLAARNMGYDRAYTLGSFDDIKLNGTT